MKLNANVENGAWSRISRKRLERFARRQIQKCACCDATITSEDTLGYRAKPRPGHRGDRVRLTVSAKPRERASFPNFPRPWPLTKSSPSQESQRKFTRTRVGE